MKENGAEKVENGELNWLQLKKKKGIDVLQFINFITYNKSCNIGKNLGYVRSCKIYGIQM